MTPSAGASPPAQATTTASAGGATAANSPTGSPATAPPTAPATGGPVRRRRGAPRLPGSTPGRLKLLLVVLLPLVVLVWAADALVVSRSADAAHRLRDRLVPAVADLDQGAAALEEADRAAAAALASGAFDLTGPGQRYQDAVKRAGQSLEQAVLHHEGSDTAELQSIDALIVEYTDMVGMAQSGMAQPARTQPVQAQTDQAQTDQTQSGTGALAAAGVEYASDLLHQPDSGVLARISALRDKDLTAVHRVRSGFWVSSAAVLPYAGLALVAVVVLAVGHRFVRRRFRRVFSPALIAAGLALVALSVWTVVHTRQAHDQLAAGAGADTARLDTLWQARAQLQRAVGAEALGLVNDAWGTGHRPQADAALAALAAPLPDPSALPTPSTPPAPPAVVRVPPGLLARALAGPVPASVRDAVQRTVRDIAALARTRASVRLQPQPAAAAELLLGTGRDAVSGQADDADDALGKAAATAQSQADTQLARAGDDRGLITGGAALCALAALAVVLGLWRRIDEYRIGS